MHIPQYKFICSPPVVALLKFTSFSRFLCISAHLFICMKLFHIMFFYTRLHLYLTVFVCLRQMFTSIHSLLDFLTGYTFVLGPYVLSFCTWHVLLYSVIIHVCPSLYLGLFLSPELDKNFVWCLLDTIKLSNTVSAVFEEDIKHRFI